MDTHAVLLPYPNPGPTDYDDDDEDWDDSASQYFEDMTEQPPINNNFDTGDEFEEESVPLVVESNHNPNTASVNSSVINDREFTASEHPTSNRSWNEGDPEEAQAQNRVPNAADNPGPEPAPEPTTSTTSQENGGGKKRRHKSTIFLFAGISSLILCLGFSLMAVFYGSANKETNKSTPTKQPVDPTTSSSYTWFPPPQPEAPTEAPTPAPTRTPKFPGWLQPTDDTDSTTSSSTGNNTTGTSTTGLPEGDVPTGEIVKVTIRSFGIAYDIDSSDVPSDQNYYGAANVMLSFLDSYLLEKYPRISNKQGRQGNSQPYASYNSSSLYPPRESFAFSLLSGAMHDLRGTLSFEAPTAPGQSVPTPEELNEALEEAFRGDSLASVLELLASELPAGNVFSTTTSTQKVEPAIPDPLPPEDDPTSAPTMATTMAMTTMAPVLPIEVVEVAILPFGLAYDLDRSDVPYEKDYEAAADVIFSFLDAHLLEEYPSNKEVEDIQAYAQYSSSSSYFFMGASKYSLISGAVHDIHGTLSFVQPTKPGQMVPTPEELNQALEDAFTGTQLVAAVGLLALQLPPENIFSTTVSIEKVEPINSEADDPYA